MEYWEINKNLADEQYGMSNYQIFRKVIHDTKDYFNEVFGVECLNKVPFSVDNATAGSGYTPISTPVLGKLVVIKLGIKPNDCEAQIVYQFAHELTHVVFRAYFGMNKPHATNEEEEICTATSLTVLKHMYPNDFNRYEQYTANLNNLGYRNGVPLAKEVSYDMEKIKSLIATFPGYENSNVETETDCLDSQ